MREVFSYVIGLGAHVAGIFFVTNFTPAFTKAIAAANCDGMCAVSFIRIGRMK